MDNLVDHFLRCVLVEIVDNDVSAARREQQRVPATRRYVESLPDRERVNYLRFPETASSPGDDDSVTLER